MYAYKRNFNISSGELLTSISPLQFFKSLKRNNIDFFTGVPDSLLKNLCLCIDDNVNDQNHIITANEGNAIALGAGYHIATGGIPLIYMQNSGLGNAINPLLSLCDPSVYSIPLILLIGWRGKPGIPDEPQHQKQGEVQLDLLETLDIPYKIISKTDQSFNHKIASTVSKASKQKRPCAIIIEKKTFDNYEVSLSKVDKNLNTREESLSTIIKLIPENSIIVSTTGKTSREIFEIREKNREDHNKDFLTVGSMGHCSSIALGIAISKPERKVFCIDGDGSLIMHMGSLSTVGKLSPNNFFHILINNFVHESVGGQETSAKFINMVNIAEANGYRSFKSVKNNLEKEFSFFLNNEGPSFLEIIVNAGSREDLGRPTINPLDNKRNFIENLKY